MAQPPVNLATTYLRIEGLTPAQLEEQKLLLLYEMRDRLMRDNGLSEVEATRSVVTVADVLVAVEPDEAANVVRYLRRIERRRRDERIRSELRTGNAEEVARKHGVSVSRAYEIAGAR